MKPINEVIPPYNHSLLYFLELYSRKEKFNLPINLDDYDREELYVYIRTEIFKRNPLLEIFPEFKQAGYLEFCLAEPDCLSAFKASEDQFFAKEFTEVTFNTTPRQLINLSNRLKEKYVSVYTHSPKARHVFNLNLALLFLKAWKTTELNVDQALVAIPDFNWMMSHRPNSLMESKIKQNPDYCHNLLNIALLQNPSQIIPFLKNINSFDLTEYYFDTVHMLKEYPELREKIKELPSSERNTLGKIHDAATMLVNDIKKPMINLYSREQHSYVFEFENVQFVDPDYQVIVPKTNHELLDWGFKLSICVGSYDSYILNHFVGYIPIILGVTYKGEITYCLEINQLNALMGTTPTAVIRQFKGRKNQSDELCKKIQQEFRDSPEYKKFSAPADSLIFSKKGWEA